jgi:hypothetical protein
MKKISKLKIFESQKLRSSKKAKILLIGVITLFVTYVMFNLYISTNIKINKFESIIGEQQLTIIDTYQKGEKFLFYLDESANLAYNKALYESFQTGLGGGCEDNNLKYPLINNDEKTCYPDIKKDIKNNFDKNFKDIIKNYPEDIPDYETKYYVLEDSFVGRSKNYLRTDVNGQSEYNFKSENPKIEFISNSINNKNENEDNEKPIDPNDDLFETQIPVGQETNGKCKFVSDYAQTYLGCPYSLDVAPIVTPQYCHQKGLTCATFVQATVYYTLGPEQRPWGNGNQECESSSVTKIGTDPRKLNPGDIFQTEIRRSNGQFTAWGHTGMYVGKGYVSRPGGVYCYKEFTPNPKGDYVFIHSYGWENLGKPGVCYDTYNHMFVDNIFVLTAFCRPNNCF